MLYYELYLTRGLSVAFNGNRIEKPDSLTGSICWLGLSIVNVRMECLLA